MNDGVGVAEGVWVELNDGVGVLLELGVKVAVDDSELDGDWVFEGVDVTEGVLVVDAVFVEDGDGD